MEQDAHLIFEGWKDKILPAALALGIGAPTGNYIGNKLKEPSDKEKYDYASMAYQDAVFLGGDINNAAKLYVYYSSLNFFALSFLTGSNCLSSPNILDLSLS